MLFCFLFLFHFVSFFAAPHFSPHFPSIYSTVKTFFFSVSFFFIFITSPLHFLFPVIFSSSSSSLTDLSVLPLLCLPSMMDAGLQFDGWFCWRYQTQISSLISEPLFGFYNAVVGQSDPVECDLSIWPRSVTFPTLTAQ